VAVETVTIVMVTPEGHEERMVRERWTKGGMLRQHVIEDTFEEATKVARLLYGGVGALKNYEREDAIAFFGRAEVLKEELKRSCTFVEDPLVDDPAGDKGGYTFHQRSK